MGTIVVRALAKINLAINILKRREDGYHDIEMVSIPLKLHDSVEITPIRGGGETYLFCDDPTIVCDETNLAYKALDFVKNECNINKSYQIMLYKRIPVQAGLGGGSADAAAVIKAFQACEKNTQLFDDKKDVIATKISSDVPFCLYDKPAKVTGKGEKLEFIKVAYPYHVLIVKPEYGLSTKSIYEMYDKIEGEIKRPNIDELIKALADDDEELIEKNIINVLYYPAVQALPMIKDILNKFVELNLPCNGMSGTGSACFALSKDKKKLENASEVFKSLGYITKLTQFALF